MARSEDLAALTRLLEQLFGADELRRFVASTPDVGDLLDQIPGPTAAPAAISFAIVQALHARDLLDSHFFARLRAARPRRRDLPDQLEGLAHFLSQRTGPWSRLRASAFVLLAVVVVLTALGFLLRHPEPASLSPEPAALAPPPALDAPGPTMPSQATTAPPATANTCIACNNNIEAPGGTVTVIGIKEGR